MQYQSVAGGPATGQPVDGAWVAVEPVVIAPMTRRRNQAPPDILARYP
ncbi:Uncharacterised protein [Mycobacterium tuberculosis]|uniref:Uncharacterized protein n=1 Tax=Mycobacterium tuberculosis TaxID=1773 RepID=A0A916LDH7_MYCTX|nr:Uncharacterised protein [Mycobacterium tuberculosis]